MCCSTLCTIRLFSLGPAVGWQADSDAEADPAAKKKGGAEAAGSKTKKGKKDKKGKKGKKLDGAGEGEDEDEDALRRRAELELLLLDESETPCVASTDLLQPQLQPHGAGPPDRLWLSVCLPRTAARLLRCSSHDGWRRSVRR